MTRKLVVAGNWKLNGNLSLAKAMIEKLGPALATKSNVECRLYPAMLHLLSMATLAQSAGVQVGGQNGSQHQSGAYTGEVSFEMLAEAGIKHVLIGHSERRALFGETNELIAEKVDLAFSAGLHITLCIGETLEQHQQQKTFEVVAGQLAHVISRPELLKQMTIAYEPVWAIGTGKTATPEQAQEVHAYIRHLLTEVDPLAAQQTAILYGGSVKAANAKQLFAQPDIDGGLVGGASLNVDEFLGILQCTN